RLVLRFGPCPWVALALAAAAVLMVVRHLVTVQAEHAATTQARVIANSSFRGSLRASDFAHPVDGDRRAALDGLVRMTALREDVLMVELYAHDGEVTYSTDHRRIGGGPGRQRQFVGEALTATVRGDATTLPAGTAGSDHPRRVLRTYAPVPVKGGTGVVAIFQNYAPIAAAAASTFLPTAGVFEAALVLLFIALVPILRRTTPRIRRQMEEFQYR